MLTEEQAVESGLSLAVRANGLLFCSGQIGIEADGSVPADPQRQYELAFAGVGKVLADNGCTPADIVDMMSFHVNYPQHMDVFMAEKTKFLAGARPAWTAIGVAAVGYPETLVEVKVIARLKA